MQPLSMSLVSGQAAAGQKGVALGLRFTVNQLAQVIGPPFFGLAVAAFGLSAAFFASAGVAWSALIGVGRLALEKVNGPAGALRDAPPAREAADSATD
jgi:MFS family permease